MKIPKPLPFHWQALFSGSLPWIHGFLFGMNVGIFFGKRDVIGKFIFNPPEE